MTSLRRSARQPAGPAHPSKTKITEKRKAPDPPSPEEQITKLLHDPKSPLTTITIADIFNARSWNSLSDASKIALLPLLPSTTFRDFRPCLGTEHPAYSQDELPPNGSRNLENFDVAIFTDPHFLSAARTFQDHLFSGWATPSQHEKVQQYLKRLGEGTLHAPWKDDEWISNNVETEQSETTTTSNARFMRATEVKLCHMARDGLIQEGDILVYKRRFNQLNTAVEKDVLVQAVNSRTHALTVVFQSGEQKLLPSGIVRRIGPEDPSPPSQTADITSPSSLENALLDTDGRVAKNKRPNGNAWKNFTVWRWLCEVEMMPDLGLDDERGGRESHGTLFYLRGCYFQEI